MKLPLRGMKTTFAKVNALVVSLLIPIIVLYTLSNATSVRVVEEEIKMRNVNRLSLIQKQIDASTDNLSSYLYTLSADPDISDFGNIQYYGSYKGLEIKRRLAEKLMLYREQSNWDSDIRVYNVTDGQALGSDRVSFDKEKLQTLFHPDWGISAEAVGSGGQERLYFVKHLYKPFDATYSYEETNLVFEVRFPASILSPLLDQLKVDSHSDPFLYIPGHAPLTSGDANRQLIATLLENVRFDEVGREGSRTVKLGDEQYLVSYVRSESMNWVLVDYVPLKIVLAPITTSNNLFYVSVCLLLALSLVATTLLYRNVHRPIQMITKSMQRFQQGDFGARLESKQKNEFSLVFHRFNAMAEQIQHLIQKVYEGKIVAHEAKLKLLQSQINPHFLYNSLNFIKHMARLGNEEAVEAMALHLGKYYRFIQRSEKEWVALEEEIQLIHSFLEIHALRLKPLQYDIEVSEEMKSVQIPRLLIQPIVENAVLHGVQQKKDRAEIRLTASRRDGMHTIVVEDNGVGMTPEALQALTLRLKLSMDDDVGCGLWNVRQRLLYQFGEQAEMELASSGLGGLKVTIQW